VKYSTFFVVSFVGIRCSTLTHFWSAIGRWCTVGTEMSTIFLNVRIFSPSVWWDSQVERHNLPPAGAWLCASGNPKIFGDDATNSRAACVNDRTHVYSRQWSKFYFSLAVVEMAAEASGGSFDATVAGSGICFRGRGLPLPARIARASPALSLSVTYTW
jgi:hypothetical protein